MVVVLGGSKVIWNAGVLRLEVSDSLVGLDGWYDIDHYGGQQILADSLFQRYKKGCTWLKVRNTPK